MNDKYDRYFDSDLEDVSEEEYLADKSYGTVKSKKSDSYRHLILPVIGAGLLILLMLIFWYRAAPGGAVDAKRLRLLENRIEALENQLVRFNEVNERLTVIDAENKKLQLALERFDRTETSMSHRLDSLSMDVASLQATPPSTAAIPKQPSSAKAKPAPPPPVKKKAEEAAVTVVSKNKTTHVVQPGETLYSISRRYGLTVDQLRQLNNIGKDNTIHPGRELHVGSDNGHSR